MAKAKSKKAPKAPREMAEVAYDTPSGRRKIPLVLPVRPGAGEQIVNMAEKDGCTDIGSVRAQIQKLPHH